MDEGQRGTRIISPNKIWNANKAEIQQLLMQIAQQNNITVKDAAEALKNTVQRLTGGIAP
jgi:hypothetical protein